MTNDLKYNILIAVLIFLVSVVVFSQTLFNEFIWDSYSVIVKEQRIDSITDAMRFFSGSYTAPASNEAPDILGGLTSVNYYRPLVGVFHAIEKASFGINPFPYKLVNLLLNSFVSVLAFFIILHITSNRLISAFSSLLFACNPTKAEVVYWVYSDSHILVAFFLFASFLLYLKHRPVLSVLVFIPALLSQENAILLPFIILSYDLLIRRQTPIHSLKNMAPYFSLSVIYLFIRYQIVGGIPLGSLSLSERLAGTVTLIQRHVKIFFVADAPVTTYRFSPDFLSFSNTEASVSLIIVILIMVGIYLLWRHDRAYSFWCAWFFIWLSVAFNVGSLGDYFMAEKALYIASLGLCVLTSGILLSRVQFKNAAIILLTGMIFFHAQNAYSRAVYWKNTTTYLEKALDFDPDFSFYRYSLGLAYCGENRHSEAIDMFLSYLQKNDQNTFYRLGTAEAYFSYGIFLYSQGQTPAAIEAYNKSLIYHPYQPRIYNNIGNIYLLNREFSKSIDNYNKAISLEPDFFSLYYNLGLAYQGMGDHVTANKYFQKYSQLSGQPVR